MGGKLEFDELSCKVIGLALEVHKQLGPGLLESAYEECLSFEFAQAGLNFVRQEPIPLAYKEITLDCGYRADLIVERTLLLELKSVASIDAIHHAQLLTYMRLASIQTGLLINFNVPLLKNGIQRFVL